MGVPVLAGLTPEGAVDPGTAERVAGAWLAGGLVGLPTETVYGLAADAQSPEAVARVYAAKGRPADHPVIVHVQGAAALDGWSDDVGDVARTLADAMWPGPLTLVVRRAARAVDQLTGGQPTIALRCPAHPVALACIQALARASGDPARGVAAPSANRFGRVSPTTAEDVVAELAAHLDPGRDLVVDGGRCGVGVESTIVDATLARPRILRTGAITEADLAAVLGVHDRSTAGPAPGAADVRAPGTLASHYAPAAVVSAVEAEELPVLVAGLAARGSTTGGVGLLAPAGIATPNGWARLAGPTDTAQYAHVLYGSLRRADRLGLARVVAVLPDPESGPLAAAVRDRLARAAHPDRAG